MGQNDLRHSTIKLPSNYVKISIFSAKALRNFKGYMKSSADVNFSIILPAGKSSLFGSMCIVFGAMKSVPFLIYF